MSSRYERVHRVSLSETHLHELPSRFSETLSNNTICILPKFCAEMAGYEEELNEFFHMPAQAKLPSDVLGELQSTIRLHSMTPQELFFKWESYSIKMGLDQTKLNIDTVRALKKDIQETLDQEARGKSHLRGAEKRTVHATPRAGVNNDDVFGM